MNVFLLNIPFMNKFVIQSFSDSLSKISSRMVEGVSSVLLGKLNNVIMALNK